MKQKATYAMAKLVAFNLNFKSLRGDQQRRPSTLLTTVILAQERAVKSVKQESCVVESQRVTHLHGNFSSEGGEYCCGVESQAGGSVFLRRFLTPPPGFASAFCHLRRFALQF